jgi:hypothetical protein
LGFIASIDAVGTSQFHFSTPTFPHCLIDLHRSQADILRECFYDGTLHCKRTVMKNIIKNPVTLTRALKSRLRAWRIRLFYRQLPVQEVFSKIYRSNTWGSHADRPFCSGEGSTREGLVGPYCDKVRAFIQSQNIRHVVDLGCGDFGVGSRLLAPDLRYTEAICGDERRVQVP